jgi:hypothetical protein
MKKPTDLSVLRALLAVKARLSPSEDKAFTGMLTDLENGRIINLSKAQRQWAEQRYYHLQLDQVFRDTPPPKIKVRRDPPVVFPWEKEKLGFK